MGYFNYFIKCIIRNIAYKITKPKVLITILLSFCVLMFLRIEGYCTEGYVVYPSDGTDNSAFQFDNNYLSLSTMQEQLQQDFITYLYASYDTNPEATKSFAQSLLNSITQGTSSYKGFYIEAGVGGSRFKVYNYFYNSLSVAYNGAYTTANTTFINIPYMTGTFYERSINPDGSFVTSSSTVTKNVPYPFLKVFVPEFRDMFVDFGLITTSETELLEKIDSYILEASADRATMLQILALLQQQTNTQNEALKEQNQLQEENNNLQQENNNLQQEQNDFLKQETSDSDVSVDSFNSVDSNDITSTGLTGVFNNIFHVVNAWAPKDISLPIPFTGKRIYIPSGYTYDMLNNSGASWVITFVSAIYYFIVSRFIIYSITDIINSIKSGSILNTDSGKNITTDML